MYERNAIILERYFDDMFGYNMRNNIKTNFKDYSELVACLEKYKDISDEEETIMQEYDSIANKIREIQKSQDNLNKKNAKLQEERSRLFDNIDENTDKMKKSLDSLNNNIQIVNDEIEENAQRFVEVVDEFDQKSAVRTTCGRTRRTIENEYNKKLNETLDNYQNIDTEIEKDAKKFIESETVNIENELKEKMKKNGEKEKVPFNINVIAKAIAVTIDIQKREAEIYTNIYDRTNRLFTEIKNNSTKIEKHKKAIKDANCKLEFLAAIKEYLIQFLDNERLTSVNGKEEHNQLMDEACKNLDEDLIQINNLYTLLLKEITKKITKKSYNELYKLDYLANLEKKSEKFDNEIRKLNLSVTIINPNYWRIEGMKKIYDVFYKCVTENYDRDLSAYFQDEQEDYDEDYDDKSEKKKGNYKENIKIERNVSKNKEEDTKAEIDKKIDIILGLDKADEDWDKEEVNENEDEDLWQEDNELESEDEEFWDNDEELENEDEEIWDDDEELEIDDEENEDDEFDEEDDEDDEFDDDEDDNEFNEDNEDEDEDFDESSEQDDDIDFDIWGNIDKEKNKKGNLIDEDDDEWDEELDEDVEDDENEEENETEENIDSETEENIKNKNKKTKKQSKGKHSKDDSKIDNSWENQFINISKKEPKKKKSFFDKFKK